MIFLPGDHGDAGIDQVGGQVGAAVAAVGMQVTSGNVLAVRDTLLQKAAELDAGLKLHWTPATTMPQLAGDPVSTDAASAFPEKTRALLTYCRKYVEDLRDAAHALDATARAYGLTEDDIADTMHAVTFTSAAPVVAPAVPSARRPVVQPAGASGPGLTIDQILNPDLYGG